MKFFIVNVTKIKFEKVFTNSFIEGGETSIQSEYLFQLILYDALVIKLLYMKVMSLIIILKLITSIKHNADGLWLLEVAQKI